MSADPTPDGDACETVFGRAGSRTLAATAEAILPRGGALPLGAGDAGVPGILARSAAGMPPAARAGLRAALWALELAPLARRGRRFSRLSESERAAFLERAAAARPLRRGLLMAFKTLCVAAYTSHPDVARAIGLQDGCLDEAPPREGPRLHPRLHPEIGGELDERVDVVVVGSGAGGAVVAKELAERGLSVAVVEEGAYFTRDDFTGPLLARMQRLYRDRGMTLALGSPAIPVPLGKAVGGTTVVNSGTCFRAPDAVLRDWASRHGIEGAAPEAMAPLYERVERTLSVRPVPEELLGENARVFRRGVVALGLHGAPIRRNIVGCRGCGVCALGCPSDAKQAMHLSYLPRAEAAGARIYARCRVRRILVERGRAAGVEAEILPEERHGSGSASGPRGRLRLRADAVVLAAGAVHTPLLLMENGLAPRGGAVGRGLRIHPALGVTAVFDEDVYGWRGTLQSYVMDDYQESDGLLFEVTSPLPGLSAASLPGVGAAAKQALADYRKIACVGLFVAETSQGRVQRLPGGAPLLRYALDANDTRRLVRGVAVAARVFFAAGARSVNSGLAGVPPLGHPREIEELEARAFRASDLAVVGFHPVGTAAMGADRERSVASPSGESHRLPGLWLADASLFPGCVGVNPQLTIMALATHVAARLAERLGARSQEAAA